MPRFEPFDVVAVPFPCVDLAIAGLPKPSVVRASKIATVEAARCGRIGRLPGDAATAVAAVLRRTLAAAAA